jgi:predicted nuclease of predicted toxin-antitoxin system
MRFLADECLRVEIVAALRQAGHEVATVAPADTGASDEMVLARAVRERAILLTADKDSARLLLRARALHRASCCFGAQSQTRQVRRLACSHWSRSAAIRCTACTPWSRVRKLDVPGAAKL